MESNIGWKNRYLERSPRYEEMSSSSTLVIVVKYDHYTLHDMSYW